MGFPIANTLSAAAASVSALAALGSWRAAKQANNAAKRADATAEALARIEHDRRHAELTPQLLVEITEGSGRQVRLKVTLAGPTGLDHLDQISISIRDDGFNHTARFAMSASEAAEASRVIWGPYRFIHGTDGGSEDCRSVAPVPIQQGDWMLYAMEETLAPSWFTSHENWRQRYDGQPVRLTFTCVREGYGPWTIPWEGTVSAA